MNETQLTAQEFTEEQIIQNTTWGAIFLSSAGLLFIGIGIFVANFSDWQTFIYITASLVVMIVSLVSIPISRKKSANLGSRMVFIANLILPVTLTLLLEGIGWALLVYLTLSSLLLIWRTLAHRDWPWAMIISLISFIAVGILTIIQPQIQAPSPPELTLFFIGASVIMFAFIVIEFNRHLWTRRGLRSKIFISLTAVLTPVLIISTIFNVHTQRRDLEALLLERAEAIAIAGATTIGYLLEDAVENGFLTSDQVFDREYVKYWEFDPNLDPDFNPGLDGEPAYYDKFHTSYDAFSDEHWQDLVDSFLTQQDVLYSVPVDINGYLPTHNSHYSSGDGSASTDQTKRIFDDAVGILAAQNIETVLHQVYTHPRTGDTLWDISAPIFVNGEHWGGFRVGIHLDQNQARIIATTRRSVISAAVVAIVVMTLAWFIGQYISEPIEQLISATTQAADGNLTQYVSVPNRDEITILAKAFNAMIGQFNNLIGSLEQRIAERTRALETSTEVSRRLSTILDQKELIREVVEQVQEAFDYDHAHIYLFDKQKEKLVMVDGSGTVGRTIREQGHTIKKGRGLVGRAGATNLPLLVSDIFQAEGWLPNPLIPETKAEAAIPIAIGDNVIGVLDIQDNVIGGLTETDVDLLQSIANQVAVALQNAKAYQQTQQQMVKEILMTNINQQIQRTSTIDDALKVAVRELGRALGKDTLIQLGGGKSNGI